MWNPFGTDSEMNLNQKGFLPLKFYNWLITFERSWNKTRVFECNNHFLVITWTRLINFYSSTGFLSKLHLVLDTDFIKLSDFKINSTLIKLILAEKNLPNLQNLRENKTEARLYWFFTKNNNRTQVYSKSDCIVLFSYCVGITNSISLNDPIRLLKDKL